MPAEANRSLALLALSCAVLVLAVLAPLSAAAATVFVTIEDDSYSPTSLSIVKNDKIKWTWVDTSNRHNVAVKSGPKSFKSATKRSGTFTKKFTTKGTYKLYCTVHPSEMKLKVKVK